MLAFLLSTPTIAKTVNPFEDGVKVTHLTKQQMQDLLQYVENSKQQLTQALSDAKGKDLDTVYELYCKVLLKVVLASFDKAGRKELLMRIALNEALQLTVGIPSADGMRIQTPGVLKGRVNKGLIVAILEDSIRLALKYCPQDHASVQKGNLVELPYIAFANERLAMATMWLSGIFDDSLLLNAQRVVLQNWHSTVARTDNLRIREIAASLLKVNEALDTSVSSQLSRAQAVRYLRGQIFKVLENQNALPAIAAGKPTSGAIAARDEEAAIPSFTRAQIADGCSYPYYVEDKTLCLKLGISPPIAIACGNNYGLHKYYSAAEKACLQNRVPPDISTGCAQLFYPNDKILCLVRKIPSSLAIACGKNFGLHHYEHDQERACLETELKPN